MIAAKNQFADDLYAEANAYLGYNSIMDSRTAYKLFEELKDVKPNYNNLNQLLNDARFKGTDFVKVSTEKPQWTNNSQVGWSANYWILTPMAWIIFGPNIMQPGENGIDYNFGITLNFNQISVSPERISKKEYRRKKRIKDGWKYKLDRNGNVMKDSLGNDIKTDVYKIVTARVM